MLFIPGPVEVPEVVLRASAYVQNHRSVEFRSVVKQSEELLNRFADSSHTVLTTGSGTTAVESLIYSMIAPGEKVLAVTFGEFGNRMIESLERRGAVPITVKRSDQELLHPDELGDALGKDASIETVFLVHNETGNGTQLSNLKALAQEAGAYGKKVLVDSVSGFGAAEIMANKWGIHAFASCSQKGLASVPGLGIICIGEEGVRHILRDRNMPAYLDLNTSLAFLAKHETPFTPSTGSFMAMLVALRILEKEGLERRWIRHQAVASFVRKELEKSGFSLYGIDGNYSDSVVAFRPVSPSTDLVKKLSQKDIVVSKGIGQEAERMIRLGLLGVVDGQKVSMLLNALFWATGEERSITLEDFPPETRIDPRAFDVDLSV